MPTWADLTADAQYRKRIRELEGRIAELESDSFYIAGYEKGAARVAELEAALHDVEQEAAELRYIGDGLQSGASRLGEYIERGDSAPYEVAMACAEVRDYVAQWTDTRTGYAVSKEKNLDD